MFARFSLATGLLACLALFEPAPAEADDTRVIIGVPSVQIDAPPLSIQFGAPPYYQPYYYPPPPYYYPAPIYYAPRYHHRHRYHPHHRHYRNHYYRRDYYRGRW